MILTNKKLLLLSAAIFFTPTLILYAQKEQRKLSSSIHGENKIPYAPMALSAEYIGAAISDSNWYNWCVSPLQTRDGKVHIFGSRWPQKEGMEGWTGANAEIAHFISDNPEGPFKYIATIMKTAMLPDTTVMTGPHNPRLEYIDGKYILLYICQNPTIGSRGQRIGMMISDDINGPWKFAGNNKGIMIEPSKMPSHWTYNAAIGADNPAFLKIDKKYYIYFKCGTPDQMKAKYGYAVSDKIEGPYILCDTPATDNASYLEDAQAFSYQGKYYLLTTDNLGDNTGVYGDLILWRSDTGLDFKLSNAQIAMGNIFDYWGTAQQKDALLKNKTTFIRDASGKFERPAILFVHGKPAYFYAVADVNIHGLPTSESYVFKIKWE